MPRKKISEFRAKSILCEALSQPYDGLPIDAGDKDWPKQLSKLPSDDTYVVKVDQGVKGRFKKGLVKLDRTPDQIPQDIASLAKKGFQYFLVEPFRKHGQEAEYYLSFERTRDGNAASYSTVGGVDVEASGHAMKHTLLGPDNNDQVSQALGMPLASLEKLAALFDDNFFSFLEVNPLIVTGAKLDFLDAAVEVDDEASPLVSERWTPADMRDAESKTPEEEDVEQLASRSQASFRLKVLNEDGSVFLLLSGGGASIVMADAVASAGHGAQLANYGEYSGNPNLEETYLYTKAILNLMIRSHAPRKVLIIGGGVANFTDIRITFKGVIKALEESAPELAKQHIKVFVRRGGPHEAQGLAAMRSFLEAKGLLGKVVGPEVVLTDIVPDAIATLSDRSMS